MTAHSPCGQRSTRRSCRDILEEYSEELDVKFNTEQVLAYANEKLTRYGSDGGDLCLYLQQKRFYPC